MKTFDQYSIIRTDENPSRANFHVLSSCVLPRPIAFVSTMSAQGQPNLAPFSFFNIVGSNPPAIMFSPATKVNGTKKDTLVNIYDTGEFVVNVVPHAIVEPMNQASFPYEHGINEFEKAGFTPLPSSLVKPFRVAESPVHMECRLIHVVPVGDGPLSGNIVIGHVVAFHIADGYLQPNGQIDPALIDLVGRMGGDDYVTIRDRFVLPKPETP